MAIETLKCNHRTQK